MLLPAAAAGHWGEEPNQGADRGVHRSALWIFVALSAARSRASIGAPVIEMEIETD